MKFSRTVYRVVAWIFVVGVLVQVFFAGMTVVAHQWPWTNHIMLGSTLMLPLIIMLVTMYTGRLPRQVKLTTWLLLLSYLVTVVAVVLRQTVPVISAFHPVLALPTFALGFWLAWQEPKLVRMAETPAALPVRPSEA